MITVLIDNRTSEGKQLLELIRRHKSVTVVEDDIPAQPHFDEAAAACNAVTVDDFFDELDQRITKRFHA